MKNIILFLAIFLFTISSFANDILSLTNGMTFDGKVVKIKDCAIIFKADGKKYIVPANDIYSIEFGDVNDRIYRKYLKMTQNDPDKCLNGKLDAENYHGKKGTHAALGFLFGPFAMIGTAIATPSPDKGRHTLAKSQNKDQFNDPEYLSCYKRKAKGQNILFEGIGWGAWILLVLLI